MSGPEPWVLDELLQWLPERGGCFVDAGAHMGEWSLSLAHRFEQVVAVEPQGVLAEGLFAQAPHNLTVVRGGLWDCPCMLRFTTYASSAHLSAVFDQGGINTGTPVGEAWMQCFALDALRLDCPVDFLKVDVEAAEVRVLHGAAALVERERPLLCVETHSRANESALLQLLGGWCYGVTVVRHPGYVRGSELWHGHAWLIGHP